MITGGVSDSDEKGEPGVLRMPPEIIKAACAEARKLGYKVAAHVEGTSGLKPALENGVDTIEHGGTPTEEIIQLFKEKGAADVLTLSPVIPYAVFDLEESGTIPEMKYNGRMVMDGMINCAKACLENDIPVGLGNDVSCPFITRYNFWRELHYFHKYCGVSKSFVLYTATLGNAKIIGLDDVTGSIEKGKSADMIVAKGNPLEDFAALKDLSMVIMKGRQINNIKIKKRDDVDALLDKYM